MAITEGHGCTYVVLGGGANNIEMAHSVFSRCDVTTVGEGDVFFLSDLHFAGIILVILPG